MELPKRKLNRLPEYDYSSPGAYFITICTEKRKNLFWGNARAVIGSPQDLVLSKCGQIVQQTIMDIPTHYPAISVDQYAIMPNHVHLLLQIHSDCGGRSLTAPTVATVVRHLKGIVTKRAGFPIWQKGFYDHVVRGEHDYREIGEYIEGNPVKWAEDKLCMAILNAGGD